MRRLSVALVAAALVASAQAHAYLESSDPADGAVLSAAPEAITLRFTENLEVGFSTFKLYRVDDAPAVDDPDFAAKLNGVAALLVNDVIGAAEPDDRAVQLDLAPAQGEAAELTLTPKEPLAPGSYVVMWRILSADTHVLQAFMTFTVTP